jgi:putative flippase GtrA
MGIKTFIHSNKYFILRFITIGLLNAIFYFFLFNFFWKWLNLNYNIAITIAYGIAIISYFFLTRRFTFKSNKNPMKNQILRFIVLLTFNYFITIIAVHFTVKILLYPPNVGVLFAIATTTISSYFIGKCWVFQNKGTV